MEAGAGVDMVSSDTVGAVCCGRPLVAAADSFNIFSVAFHYADTRGVLIIPQNRKFIYNNFV
jgi:hypothetical protein